MQLRLAWRNVWRNKRRSLLTMGAMALGVCAIVFGTSFQEAYWVKMIGEVTSAQFGDIQVHGKGWQEEPEIGTVVHDPDGIEAEIRKALPGTTASQRVVGYGLAGSERQSAAVLIMGVQPAREPSGKGPYTVVKGDDLAPEPHKRALLGRTLADQLELQPGDELVMVGQAVDGSLANDRYTVSGIADAGSDELDGTAVFLDLPDAQSFFGLGDGVNELLVRLPEQEEDVSAHLEALRGALDLSKLEALSWDQMLPELKNMIEQKRNGIKVIAFVVFIIVGLGVLNAMTMATFERTRELGVMASLGARRGRILRLVMSEALLQGIVGLSVGILVAAALLASVGSIDMGSVGGLDAGGVRLPSSVVLALHAKAIVTAAVTVLGTVLVGGLWPAWRASRLRPVEATRYV